MLDPRLLLSKGEPLVDVGEDWPYGAGDVYVSHRFGIISLFHITAAKTSLLSCYFPPFTPYSMLNPFAAPI